MSRTIYINSKIIPEAPDFIPVNKVLPRGKQTQKLYSVELEEDIFHEHFNNFYEYLCDPQIEGIYEGNMPLQYRILLMFNSIVKSKRRDITLSDRNISQIFEYKDFDMGINPSIVYLPPNSFKSIFISHSRTG